MKKPIFEKKSIALFTNIISHGGLNRQISSYSDFFIENGCLVHIYSILPEQRNKTLLKQSNDLIIHYPQNSNSFSTLRGILKNSIPLTRVMLSHLFTPSSIKNALSNFIEINIRQPYVYKKNCEEIYSQFRHDNTQKKFEFIIGFNFQTIPVLYQIKRDFGNNVKYVEISSPKWRGERGMIKRDEKKYLEMIDDIIVPSQTIGEELLQSYNIDRAYTVLPLYLKMPSTQSSNPLNEYPFTFGVATRLDPGKNLDLLIKIMFIIKNFYDNKRIKLILAGSGTIERRLRSTVHELKLEDNVIFLGHVDNILDFIEKIGVVVLLSDVESVSATLLESLYFRKPIIASNVGSTKDIVQDGVNGYLIRDMYNLDDIAQKILSILLDKEKYYRMANKSRQIYDDSYMDTIIKMQIFYKVPCIPNRD